MSKEKLIEEFKNKYGLNGLHAKPTEYMDYEDKTDEVEKDFIKAIDQTREETIEECLKISLRNFATNYSLFSGNKMKKKDLDEFYLDTYKEISDGIKSLINLRQK